MKYFLQLAKRHGTDLLKHGKNVYYFKEDKERIIKRALVNHESANSVPIDPKSSTLVSWFFRQRRNNVIGD